MRTVLVLLASCLLLATVVFAHNDDDDASVEFENNVNEAREEAVEKPQKAKFVKPTVDGNYFFLDWFETNSIGTKWLKSKAKKEDIDESIAKYDGDWAIEQSVDSAFEEDKGLVLKSRAKHHAIAARLLKPFQFALKKPLVIQYEVKFQNPMDCGGAYIKLLADEPGVSLESFYDKTSFSIMFGPDKCGTENKYHFIIRFKNPVTGKYEEKHAKKAEIQDTVFSDGKTHLFKLVLRPDNTFKMYIDGVEANSGSLLTDLNPAINPPKEIVDSNDVKPESWDDREKIADPDAVKPDDWDENEPSTIADPNAVKPDGWLDNEPETVQDPSAVKPDDWDQETDGEWEAPKIDNPRCKDAPGCGQWNPPMISNPKFKGKWKAPLIDNLNYQGKWEPRRIPNPEYFENNDPFASLTPFSAIGLELWSMTDNIYFDNFIITDDEDLAEKFGQDTWILKKAFEFSQSKSSDSVIDSLIKAADERPWLWGVYILVILVPIVIIAVFCVGTGKSSSGSSSSSSSGSSARASSESKSDAQTKKTDAETRDDEEEEVAEEEEEDAGAADASAQVRKEDLEEDVQQEEQDEPEQVEEKEPTPPPSPKTTKRKPRKE